MNFMRFSRLAAQAIRLVAFLFAAALSLQAQDVNAAQTESVADPASKANKPEIVVPVESDIRFHPKRFEFSPAFKLPKNDFDWRAKKPFAAKDASEQRATPEETAPPSELFPPAPQTSPPSLPPLEKQFLKNILRDQKAIWTSPFRLRGEDAKWLAPLGAATTALIAADRRTSSWVSSGGSLPPASRIASFGGSTYTTGSIAAGFYFVGRATNNRKARETGLLAAEALINSQIVTQALKHITRRPRPNFDDGRGRFFTGGNSFPSGHAANAWSVATVIAYEYQDRPLVRYGAFAAATMVSLSRYSGRKHFLSDVLIGSAVGFGVGRFVYRARHADFSQSGATEPEDETKFPANQTSGGYIRPNAEARFKSYVSGVVGPYALLGTAALAGIYHYRDLPPEWENDSKGYARRFASGLGIQAVRATTVYALDEAFRLDSNFYKSTRKKYRERLIDAVVSTYTARTPSGKRVFGFPRIVGNYTAMTVAYKTWYPERFGFKQAARDTVFSLGFDVGINIFREFFPWSK